MRALVTAASRHGATLEIAETIAAGLERRGVDADALPAEEVGGVDDYDAVVLGSAVYYGHWLEAARTLIEEHAGPLAEQSVWLFSSGPLGPPEHLEPEGDPVDVASLVEATGALDHRIFAGKLDRPSLKFREKAVVAALHPPDGDFRDWAAVDAFAEEIAERLQADRYPPFRLGP